MHRFQGGPSRLLGAPFSRTGSSTGTDWGLARILGHEDPKNIRIQLGASALEGDSTGANRTSARGLAREHPIA